MRKLNYYLTMEHFVYQTIKSSWGIVVSVSADFVPMDSFSGEYTRTGSCFGVSGLEALHPTDRDAFLLGVRILGSQIEDRLQGKPPLIMRLQKLDYNVADFQVEGITCAVIGLLANKFGIPNSSIEVGFDKPNNRYTFDFPELD